MTKSTSTSDPQIHALTVAEIARQIKIHSERRRQITEERAELYRSSPEKINSPAVDADERASREHAKHLLNGAAPKSLSLPPEISRDRILAREERAIDIVLKILSSQDLAARAAEAVSWAEAHSDEWQALARAIILTAVKLDSLEREARELIAGCGDIFSVRLPLINVVGGRPISETPLGELIERALAEGVLTSVEIRKAENG